MAEYIEREAAIDAVSAWYRKACRPENMSSYNMGERAAYTTAISEIAELPAADVRHVVRAYWTDHRTIEHDGEWYCSACGKEITIYMGPDRKDRYAFCPNCGADMRGES